MSASAIAFAHDDIVEDVRASGPIRGAARREDDAWDAAFVEWMWQQRRGIWRREKLLFVMAADLMDFSEWYCTQEGRC